MLITKRSRRRSDLFGSRFRDSRGNFPLRQYLRCREEVYSGTVHSLLLIAFMVAIFFLGRATWLMFRSHEVTTSPWLRHATLASIACFILFLGRRLWLKIQELREVREELRVLRHELENLDEDSLL